MGAELAPGYVIDGRYRVDRVLGQGGMGTVWAATHVVTRKPVALKVLVDSASDRPEMRRRFQREARAASAVTHPNIVAVHDIFEMDGGAPVMVMDLLVGEPLENKLLREGRLSVEETARVLVPVISAVGTVHERGIVHRDLKPANIFLAEEDGALVVKVLDFGIAKLSTAERAVGQSGALTSTGAMMGTPFYMAPEQCVGERDIDHRADVWALGVIVFECLSGRRPIVAENLGQVIKKVLVDGMPALSVPGVPDDIARLVGRMLARERGDRPQDLREVKELLEKYAPPGTRAPSFGPPAAKASDGVPSSDVPVRSGTRVVAGARGVDAEAITANASSGADLAAARPVRATSEGGARRGRIAAGVLFAIVAAMGGVAVLTRAKSGDPSGNSSASRGELAAQPTAGATATATSPSSIASAPATASAAPIEAGSAGSQAALGSAAPPAEASATASSTAPSARVSPPRSPVAPAASVRAPVPPVVSAAPAASSAGRPTPGALIERAPF